MSNSNPSVALFKATIACVLFFTTPLLSAQQLAHLDTSLILEKQVQKAFDEMNRSYKKDYTIVKTTGPTKATRNFEIQVNIQKLQQVIQSYDSSQLKWIIKLTVAHEYFHLLQFYYYKRNMAAFEPKILEAQADLLAGKYLTLRGMDNYLETKDPALLNGGSLMSSPIFRKAYGMFFDMGTNTFALADHPSREERTTSLIRGVMLGWHVDLLNRAIFNMYGKDSANSLGAKSKRLYIRDYMRKLDIPEPDTSTNVCKCTDSLMHFKEIMEWSYEHAKLIVHGDPANLSNIVLTSKEVDYKKHPLSVIKTAFKNIGDDTLLFKFENRMGKTTKDTSSNFEDVYFFENNAYHTILLYPGQEYIVIDTLEQVRNFTEIVSPPSAYSLFYCNSKTDRPLSSKYTLSSLNQISMDTMSFLNYLMLLTDGIIRSDYSKIIASMGEFTYSNPKHTTEDPFRFKGYVPPNAPFLCSITIYPADNNRSRITLDFGDIEDYRAGDSIYLSLRRILDNAYPEIVGIERSTKSYLYKYLNNHSQELQSQLNALPRQYSKFKHYSFPTYAIMLNIQPHIKFKSLSDGRTIKTIAQQISIEIFGSSVKK